MANVDSMKPNIGIDENACKELFQELSSVFSDEVSLFVKAANCHWNVLGPNSRQLCLLFREIADCSQANADKTAQNIREIGHRVPANNLNEIQKNVRCCQPFKEGEWPEAQAMLRSLLQDNENLVQQLHKSRQKVGEQLKEAAAEDFIIDLIRVHKNLAWRLRSHLEEKGKSA